MKKTFIILILLVFSGAVLFGQSKKITISGFVNDKETGEPLIGAGILAATSKGSVTNSYGFYSISLDPGEQVLHCSYIGYEEQNIHISLKRDTTIIFLLKPDAELREAVVTAHKEGGINSTHIGSLEIPVEKIRNIPVLFGEADVMKAIQMMPGVQAGTEGTSGIHVRGGGPDENLMLLDGVPIYNVDHMLGLFSVFSPDAVKKVTLYKGSFPARYSGRISSIVDVRTNDGNMKKLHGSVGTGLLSSKIHLEGPILKDKTSFSISARGMHTLLFAPLIKRAGSPANYFFYDLNGKITHRFSNKDKISASVYNGRDILSIDNDKNNGSFYETPSIQINSTEKSWIKWGNTVGALRWNHVFNGKLFSNTTLAYNRYKMNIGLESKSTVNNKEENFYNENRFKASYDSGIRDLSGRIDFDYKPAGTHLIRFGGEYIFHTFIPETRTIREFEKDKGTVIIDTLVNMAGNDRTKGHEVSLYAEDDFLIGSRLTLNPGVHLSLFYTEGRAYFTPEPRFSIKFDFGKGVLAKAAYSKMSQYIHLLSSSQITLPTDLWVPITKDIKPVLSDQLALGLFYTGLPGWEFSLEAYYKLMSNILEYKEGVIFFGSSEKWYNKVEMGKGRAFGAELFIHKTQGKTTGWLGYTLARSERLFEGLNKGRVFPYKYDRRHSISLFINHKFSKKFDIGGAWIFATGGTLTLPIRQSMAGAPDDAPYQYNYVNRRNNYRLPPNHRLNIGLNFRKHTKRGESIWNLSFYNVYNAMNPNFVFTDSEYMPDGDKNYYITTLYKITILPFLPFFSYTFKF